MGVRTKSEFNNYFHSGMTMLLHFIHSSRHGGMFLDKDIIDGLNDCALRAYPDKDYYTADPEKGTVKIDLKKLRIVSDTYSYEKLYAASFDEDRPAITGKLNSASDSNFVDYTFKLSKGVLMISTKKHLEIASTDLRWYYEIPKKAIIFRLKVKGSDDSSFVPDCYLLVTGSGEAMMVAYSYEPIMRKLYGVDTMYTHLTKSMVKEFYSRLAYKIVYDKTYALRSPFYHFTIPKKNKKGTRLISSPRYDLKRMSKVLNSVYNSILPTPNEYKDLSSNIYKDPVESLSYWKGSDFVKKISEDKQLSLEESGRFVLQIDFRDFFTNISEKDVRYSKKFLNKYYDKKAIELLPNIMKGMAEVCPGSIYADTQFVSTIMRMCGGKELVDLGFQEIFDSMTYMLVGPLIKPSVQLARRFTVEEKVGYVLTECIPIWKNEILNVDMNTVNDREVKKTDKVANTLKTAISKERNSLFGTGKKFEVENIYEVHSRVSMKPWQVRGIPQGICYSGIIANLCAITAAQDIVRTITQSSLGRMGVKINRTLQYSDNLYIFYDTTSGIDHAETIKKLILKDMDPKRWYRADKISVLDRTKRDLKMLGMIVDSEGKTRLSRVAMRKINQAHIRAYKGDRSALTDKVNGHEIYFKRVRNLSDNEGYNRQLITERKAAV
jgi:hypothetical protein